MRIGFTGGFTYDLKLPNKYRIGVDVLYAQQGFSDNFIFTDNNGVFIGEEKTEMNYSYLIFPIKFGCEFGNRIRLIPKIGIVPAILIKAE